MCFNANVSIATYVIGMIGCFVLYRDKYIPEAIFLALVIQMQLVEYFIWRNQPCNIESNKTGVEVNKMATRMGIIINHLQPFVLWLAIVMLSPMALPNWMHYLIVLYALMAIYYTNGVLNTLECTTVSAKSAPHLHWKWNEGTFNVPFYSTYLALFVLLSFYGLKHGEVSAFVSLVSYLVSYMIYKDTHAFGSVWCFSAAFAPWLLVGVFRYLDQF
jgi:hypothetical protein